MTLLDTALWITFIVSQYASLAVEVKAMIDSDEGDFDDFF